MSQKEDKNPANGIGKIAYMLLLFIIISILIMLLAKWACGILFLKTTNATFNTTLFRDNTNATLLSMCANVMLTASLILVTASYALDTSSMLKQSKEKQRIEHIEKCLESFYIPVQDILEDQQYILDPLESPTHHYNYLANVEKYKAFSFTPSPLILLQPQVLLYHVQAHELKKFRLYRYLVKEETYSLFVKVTMMSSYENNIKTYQNDVKKLLTFVKADFNELLEHVKNESNGYQNELKQLTKNPHNPENK